MKTKLICTGIVAIAASFGAAAQETSRNAINPTASRITLAGEPRLKLTADKLSPAQRSVMVAANVQPEGSLEIGVEMTPPIPEQVVDAKTDSRFDNYALENIAAGGQ